MEQHECEKHNNTKLTYTLETIRGLWSDLNDNQRMEMIKSIIWTSSDMYSFRIRVVKELNSDKFQETID